MEQGTRIPKNDFLKLIDRSTACGICWRATNTEYKPESQGTVYLIAVLNRKSAWVLFTLLQPKVCIQRSWASK
jgi:hypothetical protein